MQLYGHVAGPPVEGWQAARLASLRSRGNFRSMADAVTGSVPDTHSNQIAAS